MGHLTNIKVLTWLSSYLGQFKQRVNGKKKKNPAVLFVLSNDDPAVIIHP